MPFSKPSILKLLVLIIAAPLSTITAYAQENKEIKIGVVLCLTGACQASGNSSLKGLQLARDEINSRGGSHVTKLNSSFRIVAKWSQPLTL